MCQWKGPTASPALGAWRSRKTTMHSSSVAFLPHPALFLVCAGLRGHPPAQLPRLGASTWKGKPMTWSPLTAAATRAKSPGRLFSRWWQLLLASCAHLEQLGEGRKRKCWIRSIRHKLEAQPCLPPHATVWNAQLKGHGCKKDRCGTTSQQLQTTGRHSKTIRL